MGTVVDIVYRDQDSNRIRQTCKTFQEAAFFRPALPTVFVKFDKSIKNAHTHKRWGIASLDGVPNIVPITPQVVDLNFGRHGGSVYRKQLPLISGHALTIHK